jgi:nicotinamidase/pyrazinamidase
VNATRTALIVVDVQRDFCVGGSLPVKDGDKVVPVLNNTIREFRKAGLPVFFTRDWHPPNHFSFKSQGGTWPSHCVQETEGATFHPELDLSSNPLVISKGTNPKTEGYSGFQGTDLEWRLKTYEVNRLFIGGLATDYCVKQTSIDARRAGFEVFVLKDCVRAVDANKGDGERALKEMKKAGVRLTNSASAIYRLSSPVSPASEEE